MKKPCLILIGGKPGVGKTTLAENIYNLHNKVDKYGIDSIVIVDSDFERRQYLVEEGIADPTIINDPTIDIDHKHFGQTMSETLLMVMKNKAEKYLEAGKTVIVVTSAVRPEQREEWERFAKFGHAPFTALFLEVSDPDIALKRIREREAHRMNPGNKLTLRHYTSSFKDREEHLQQLLEAHPGKISSHWHILNADHDEVTLMRTALEKIAHLKLGKKRSFTQQIADKRATNMQGKAI